MKKLYIEIEKQYRDAEFERLLGELQEEGIEIQQLQPSSSVNNQALILTDHQETADRAKKQNIACVGYEPPDTGITISHVDMVIQGFEELDAEFFCLIYKRHHGLPWTIAETGRLLIRESIPEDFDSLYDIYQEPGMTDYMPGMDGAKEEERELFEAYIRRMYPFFSYGLWTVIEKESGNIIGRAGLENGEYKGQPVLEVGYMISAGYRHRGYGLEAVREIIDYGGKVAGEEKIYAFIHEENRESLKLIQKAGLRQAEADREKTCVFVS